MKQDKNSINDNTLANVKLLFAIQSPNLDDVYLEGYEASLANLSEATNPYKQGSKLHQFWEDGWWDAFYEETPAFMPAIDKSKAHVVANVNVVAANDATIAGQEPAQESLYRLIFNVLVALCATMLIYTVYDFAT